MTGDAPAIDDGVAPVEPPIPRLSSHARGEITMTDQPTTPANDDVLVVAAQVADEHGVLAEGAVVAEGDHALIVARFADTAAAIAIYERLRAAEAEGRLDIDGVLVAKGDPDGRIRIQEMTEHSTRTGLKWGVVGGVVAAVFLPATLVAGAVTLGLAGAAAGKARNLARRLDVAHGLAGVITPGTSGILCLVSAAQAEAVTQQMPDAQEVKTIPVDEETAEAITEAAAEAEAEAPADASAKETPAS
jgi:uncharacterized membrane protein